MDRIYYIGLDIHKKMIVYCVKRFDGLLVKQGTVAAERKSVLSWLSEIPSNWIGGMEATMFTGWVYDFLKPHAVDLNVAAYLYKPFDTDELIEAIENNLK